MLNYSSGAPRRYRLVAVAITAVFAQVAGPSFAQDPPGPVTQNRINEFAAACLTCQMSFSGLKGTPKPGETPAQFGMRVESYITALEKADRQLQPLLKRPALRNQQPDNIARWQKVETSIARLPASIADVKAGWRIYKSGGEQHLVGSKLMLSLLLIQAIMNTLRDARP